MSWVAAVLYLVLALGSGVLVFNAYRPRRSRWLLTPSWLMSWLVSELSWHLAFWGVVWTAVFGLLGAFETVVGWVALAVMLIAEAGVLHMAWISRRTVIQIGDETDDLETDEEGSRRYPRSHLVFPPLMFRGRGVAHERGVVYSREGRRKLRLDVYKPAEAPRDGRLRPAIVQVHGGAWVLGSRKEQGIPLLNHLAANGWVGFNIDYRLSPLGTWPDHLVDVKRAIAWVREHAEEYGVDPDFVCITGGSAGGHLTAMVGLTANDPEYQPGFEDADTSVAAAVPFYGVYDMTDEEGLYVPELRSWILEPLVFKRRMDQDPEVYRRASPVHRVNADAPPFLIIHGDWDSLVPVADARRFAKQMEAVSENPVVYAEMKGGQHAFDVFPSVRTVRVIEGIERFLATVYKQRGQSERTVERELDAALTD